MSEFKVVQSFSAAESPHDNAVAESFFASLKKEKIRRHYYQTESECRLTIEQYINYGCYVRNPPLHQMCLFPMEVTFVLHNYNLLNAMGMYLYCVHVLSIFQIITQD